MHKIQEAIRVACEGDLQKLALPLLPPNISAEQVQQLDVALRRDMGKKIQANVIRLLLCRYYLSQKDPRALAYASEVNLSQIEDTGIAHEARLLVSETLIEYDECMRAHIVEAHLKSLDSSRSPFTPEVKARLQTIRAGMNLLRGNYYEASLNYLNCCREEYFLGQQEERRKFIEKAIAVAFICEKTPEVHKLVCSLYINQMAKKTALAPILAKLYSESMIHSSELHYLKTLLPRRMEKKDLDQISPLEKALFSHNMLAILRSFTTVSLSTLNKLIGVQQEEMLLLIEKTYRNGEVQIDQINDCMLISCSENLSETLTKKWFDRVDEVLAQEDE